MKIRIMKISAIFVFITLFPLMLIESIVSSGNPVWRIKRNFQTVMFLVNLGHPKSSTFEN
jgi:hypothetical protein